MRIAIVGAGISGLTVARLLHRRHEVTVFEASSYAGGHTHTVPVDTPNETHQVDTGFIVFNDRNYPNFELLLRRLGVAWQPSVMSFSVSDATGEFEYSSGSPVGLFAAPRHLISPGFHRMVVEQRRFHRAARELLAGHQAADLSLRDWLEEQRFSRQFVERLIVPQVSAVWSADPRQLWSFPALFLARFFENHGMLGFRGRPRWRAIAGGSARYVEALTEPFTDRIRLDTPVRSVTRFADHVLVAAGSETQRFDHVVLATHSDQALGLLSDASESERDVLGAIPYQSNDVVLHTDTRLLPRRRRAWASWNYHLVEEPVGRTTVTYHMNRLQSLRAEREFLVTLNQTDRIDPTKIIRRFEYAHPVYTPDGIRAQARVQELSGRERTHFCGAYWGWGFHEDGVNSALRVGAAFGAGL